MIEAIIFDADGVILDSEKIWDRAQVELLRKKGRTYERDKVKHLITGRSMADGSRIIKEMYDLPESVEELSRERYALVSRYYRDELEFVPGFKEFFSGASKKYKTCIATALSDDLLGIADRRLSLKKLFGKNIYSVDRVGGIAKPNPDLFLYSARMLGVKPENCLVIEDAPNGIEAARRAGMRCIALATTHPRDKLYKADLVVDSFAEIDLKQSDF